VATYGKQLGARVFVGRWKQEMNEIAHRVAERVSNLADAAPVFRTPAGAYLWAAAKRVRGARWIAAGGSTPLGVLGHVNAGLELVQQIESGTMILPRFVVVPLGTGGTAAGLSLAFAIAGIPIIVIGARVVPRIVARAARVHRLAAATARLLERLSNERVARPRRESIVVAHETYGGAYGRETVAGRTAASRLRDAAAVTLDATYSAKAFGKAIALSGEASTLFWLTFDARWAIGDDAITTGNQ
jgi:D-cysteine desulfhydrase